MTNAESPPQPVPPALEQALQQAIAHHQAGQVKDAERMTASMLAAIGHDEWVAVDEDDYVEKVSRLAADPALRRQLRASLRDTMRRSPLTDASGMARALEDAFEATFDRWIAERP